MSEPRNAGRQVEDYLENLASEQKSFTLKSFTGEMVEIGKGVENIYTPGQAGTKCKFDIRIGNYRLQVKSGTGNSATILSAPVDKLVECGSRELFDTEPITSVYQMLDNASKVKLSDSFDKSEWSDLLTYFLFEGTSKSQEIPALQANYLLFWGKQEQVLCNKLEAIDYLWGKVYAEKKYNRGRACLSIRIAN